MFPSPQVRVVTWRAYSAIDSVRGTQWVDVCLSHAWVKERLFALAAHEKDLCGFLFFGARVTWFLWILWGPLVRESPLEQSGVEWSRDRRLHAQSRCRFFIKGTQWEISKGWSGWERARTLEAVSHRLALCTGELRECPCPTGTLNCLTQGY